MASPGSSTAPQAGRPFVITDPNGPITYGDLYFLISTLSATPFRTVLLHPILMVLIAYPIEWYSLLLLTCPFLRPFLPAISGDAKHLKPAIFSICTHLIASSSAASRPVEEGGIGYQGVLTTLEGMIQEVLDWNLEHMHAGASKKTYTSSVSLAEEIQKLGCAPDVSNAFLA